MEMKWESLASHAASDVAQGIVQYNNGITEKNKFDKEQNGPKILIMCMCRKNSGLKSKNKILLQITKCLKSEWEREAERQNEIKMKNLQLQIESVLPLLRERITKTMKWRLRLRRATEWV